MDNLLETLIFLATLAYPVSLMGITAWLAHKGVKGWGWFLLASVLIILATRIHFDGFGHASYGAKIEHHPGLIEVPRFAGLFV
jgi:hypothetical protein